MRMFKFNDIDGDPVIINLHEVRSIHIGTTYGCDVYNIVINFKNVTKELTIKIGRKDKVSAIIEDMYFQVK